MYVCVYVCVCFVYVFVCVLVYLYVCVSLSVYLLHMNDYINAVWIEPYFQEPGFQKLSF